MNEKHAAYLTLRAARVDRVREVLVGYLPEGVKLTVEFGSGHGHFLTAYGQAHPDEWCVGIDMITRRVRLSEAKARKRHLERVIFIKSEAMEFLEALAGRWTVERSFMLFPDPWPKSRHHKHRMLQPRFLGLLASVSSPGGELFFRTDHVENFSWAVERVDEHPDWVRRKETVWPFEVETYFQKVTGGRYDSFTAQANK